MKKSSIAAILVLTICALFICACKQDPTPGPTPEPKPDTVTFSSQIAAMIVDRSITVENTYKTDYFRVDSSVFNKDLALLSCPLAFSSTLDEVKADLAAMYFDDICDYANDGKDVNACSYTLGHRAVGDYELVAVHVYGMNYGSEWSGNLNVGTAADCNGDHLGFNLAAETVYAALKDYVGKNLAGKNLKIWIFGYSRAGAISGVLACDIIEGNELKVAQKDMFVYTFEAPVSISPREHQYACIHNVVMEGDLIPHIIPETYGMSRPGNDIVMKSDPGYVNDCIHSVVGEDAFMPEFTESEGYYSTPAEFVSYFVDALVNAKASEAGIPSLETRDTYVETIQERARYLAEVLMKDNMAGAGALVAYVKEIAAQGELYLAVLVGTWTAEEDGFYAGTDDYKGLKQILDESGIPYDDAKLKSACSLMHDIIENGTLMTIVGLMALEIPSRNNVMYTVTCHYPGVVYSVLKNYE